MFSPSPDGMMIFSSLYNVYIIMEGGFGRNPLEEFFLAVPSGEGEAADCLCTLFFPPDPQSTEKREKFLIKVFLRNR